MSLAENHKTILLAEDEDALQSFVFKILEGCGYRILAARDGAAALSLGRGFAGTIHLLLSDIEMPAMSGIELATQLQL